MAEQESTQVGSDKADTTFRPSLLMPVMEGNTLERDDVSGFLAGRLSDHGEEHLTSNSQHLS